MSKATLNATVRAERGTGDARKLRRNGQVPAVIYGHGREPQSLTVVTRDIDKLLTQIAAASTVIELNVEGATSNTLIREIQRHPFKRHIVHVDFQQLVAGEMVTVSVPLRFQGIPEGVRIGGGVLEETMHQVHLHVDPANIPDHITVDITSLIIGHNVHVRDLELPNGVAALDEPGATVCLVAPPKAVVDTAATAEADDAKNEPELIRKAKEEEEAKK